MALKRGWKWKTEPEWDGVLACATNGTVDVWVDSGGHVSIEGPAAPAVVVAEVLIKANVLRLAIEEVEVSDAG